MLSPLLALALVTHSSFAQPSDSPSQQATTTLPVEEINGLLTGRGMGQAKVAEVNGYPGPAHVLELSKALQLTPLQLRQTQQLFESMQHSARALGRTLLAQERELDQQFASGNITPQELADQLQRIGENRARLRETHLRAHLDQATILTPQQIQRYAQLRGLHYQAHHHNTDTHSTHPHDKDD